MNAEALSAFWSEFGESRTAVAALGVVVVINLTVDLVYALLDPRLRRGRAA